MFRSLCQLEVTRETVQCLECAANGILTSPRPSIDVELSTNIVRQAWCLFPGVPICLMYLIHNSLSMLCYVYILWLLYIYIHINIYIPTYHYIQYPSPEAISDTIWWKKGLASPVALRQFGTGSSWDAAGPTVPDEKLVVSPQICHICQTHGRLMELTVFLGSKWTSWKLNLHFPGEKGKGPQVPTVSFFSEMVDVFLLRLLEGIMLWIFVGVSEHQQLRRPAKITQFLSHNDAKVREAAAIPASVWSFGPFFWYFLNRCNVIHVLN